jgi:hypothetical protein
MIYWYTIHSYLVTIIFTLKMHLRFFSSREGSGAAGFEAESVNESVMTFGSLCNFHTYFYNIQPYANGYDDSITPRASGSPGIGAYSYHSGYRFRATRDIEAGEEIFAYYGPTWLEERGYNFPNEDDFDTAGEVILKALDGLSDTNELNDGVLSTLKNVVEYFSSDAASLIPDNMPAFKNITQKVQMKRDKISSSLSAELNDKNSETIARALALEGLSVRNLDYERGSVFRQFSTADFYLASCGTRSICTKKYFQRTSDCTCSSFIVHG